VSPITVAGLLGGAIAALPTAVSAVGKAFSLIPEPSVNKAEVAPIVVEDDSTTANLTKRLASLVRLSGIEPSDEVEIKDDGQGGIQIKGTPGAAKAVGQVLADNPDWVKDFRKLLQGNPDASIVLSPGQVQASSIDLMA
jgi:hypothetical protein